MLSSIDAEIVQLHLRKEDYTAQEVSGNPWKRPFDLFIAGFVTLFVLIWLIPLIGIIIVVTSPGPALFVQWRTGREGRLFRCLKFRTMRFKHDDKTFRQTTYNDARVTSIGRWLRKTNLDEMPQFLNVLMGDMSVVGPRPHAIQHDAQYWLALPNYYKRYSVRPGITGLAQVRGARGITDHRMKMEHRLRYDLFYIKRRSLWRDIKICWWTVKGTLQGDANAW